MTKRRLAAGLLAAAMAATGAGADESAATGLWKTAVKEDGRYLHVEIAPCEAGAATLCGTAVAAFGGASEAAVGRRILWDMAPDGPGEWTGGKVWAPDDDKTYSGRMELKGPGVLELSGCVLGGLICRGQDWTRVE